MADKIDTRLIRIEDKIDKVMEHVSSLDITSAKQQISLDYHIKRTDILENDIKPIKKHVERIHGALKFIGLVALLGGVVETVIQLLTYIKK